MSPRLEAWNAYAALVNRQREELGAVSFDANDATYTTLMAGFYLGYDAGAADTIDFYNTMKRNIAAMGNRSLTTPLEDQK